MARYVELRLHGVSGTSPESLLGVKTVDDVAGDKFVRFVRPTEKGPLPEPGDPKGDPDRVLEGMSWGRLTSGSVIQATWLLLLPFALVNLAYWARPWDREGWETAAYRWLVRIVGLSLTATIVYTAASASMDVAGWQCAIRDKKNCLAVNGWLDVTQTWGAGKVLAAAAILPALTVLALGFLAHRTSLRYEAFRGEMEDSHVQSDPDLFSRRMWRGDVLVGRLRTLHVAVGFSVTAAILARAALGLDDGGVDVLSGTALAISVAVIAVCVVLAHPLVWSRWGATNSPNDKMLAKAVVGASAAALLLAEWAALVVHGSPTEKQAHLVGIITTGHILVLSQIIALLALLMTMLVVRIWPPTPSADANAVQSVAMPPLRLALWGFAGWFIAAVAVLFGFAYSAAVIFRVSDLLTGEVKKGPCDTCNTPATAPEPAPAFEIAAVATSLFILMLLLFAAFLFARVVRRRGRAFRWVEREYPVEVRGLDSSDYRIQRAVRPRALASVVSLDCIAPLLLVACFVGIAAGLYAGWDAFGYPGLHRSGPQVPPDQASPQQVDALYRLYGHEPPSGLATGFAFLRDFGAWAVAAFAAGLIALGALAWRSEKARRIVGIIWDVFSFFPRAGHPLAPPCYAERAVPQLSSRIAHLVETTEPDSSTTVIVAGHSQGSMLGIAALAQLVRAKGRNDDTGLLSFGSPVMRLYAPIFPRLFAPARLVALPQCPRRWTNLWRRTDPIGASMQPILRRAASAGETPDPGDLRLRDPLLLGMDPETSAYQPVHWHLDYYADPAYAICRRRLVDAVAQDTEPTP
jgi:hypothetical protein